MGKPKPTSQWVELVTRGRDVCDFTKVNKTARQYLLPINVNSSTVLHCKLFRPTLEIQCFPMLLSCYPWLLVLHHLITHELSTPRAVIGARTDVGGLPVLVDPRGTLFRNDRRNQR